MKIENLVNQQIKKNINVEIKILDQKKAIAQGAIALFGEKYDDEVRVVSMGEIDKSFFSKELCGGTHVNKTGDIKKFKIINQSNVASGIRRIEAITNNSVDQYINKQKEINSKKEINNLDEIEDYMKKIKILDSKHKINFTSNETTELKLRKIKKIHENLIQKNSLSKNKENIVYESINKINFVYLIAENYPVQSLKDFIDEQKKIYENNCIALIISNNKNKLSIVLGTTNDMINKFDSSLYIKNISKILGGKGGGGRKDLAQAGGQDVLKIDEALKFLKNEISNLT